MSDLRTILERGVGGATPPLDGFERMLRRRDRKRRNQRIMAGVVGIAVFALAAIGLVRLLGSERTPAGDPRSPFQGTWVSPDVDGSTQTMTIAATGDGAIEIVVQDDAATVCSGASSTMTGTGRLEGSTELVIPSPVLTCDDGSKPEALSGLPLAEQLRDLTFVHDPGTDGLTDNLGAVWARVGGEEPSPEPTTSGRMWPQSSLEEVRAAQELADAGDPAYTWQVDPELERNLNLGEAEIFARFLREELGWVEFRSGPFLVETRWWEEFPGKVYDVPDPIENPDSFDGVTYIRCAPGRTNPLYPDDPYGGGCAPTIDELRYETVQIDVARLASHGPSGIWVVTRWVPGPDAVQAVPPSDAEVAALLEPFLQARVDGEGAEEYLSSSPLNADVLRLYATTSGAPYERFEYELVEGPVWPEGWIEFEVRLFAEDGETVVEQPFVVDRVGVDGPLELDYGSRTRGLPWTTENGQAVPVPYRFLHGEVTFAAAPPWGYSPAGWDFGPNLLTLRLEDPDQDAGCVQRLARLAVVADPRPVETGCQQGPAPADAEALARSIRSDPDLEATEPVAVTVGGIEALQMDVVAAPGASVCDTHGVRQVVTPNDHDPPGFSGVGLEHGHRMRLYLLDLPEESARILAIAIMAREASFERVMEAAAPIVDSFEFHAP